MKQTTETSQRYTSDSLFHDSLDYLLKSIQGTIDDISSDVIESMVHNILNHDRVFVYGAGRSGLVARAFAIRLAHLGLQTFVIGETICAPVKANDIVIIISGSGKTIPAVMTAEIANRIGAHLIVFSQDTGSELKKYADEAVVLPVPDDDKRRILAPLGSLFEACAWVLLDGLIAELMRVTGETEQSMRSRHATLQ